jgi:cytochrome c
MMRRAVLAVLLLASVTGCNTRERQKNQASAGGGNADRGPQLIQKYGCDACHAIPGVKGMQGMVGPALQHIASHPIIAGKFPNNPETMIRWIQNPQSLDPQSSMPNMNVTPADARDITAFLFTLK